MPPTSDKFYGNFELIGAQHLTIPVAGNAKMRMGFREVTEPGTLSGTVRMLGMKRGVLAQRHQPISKRRKIVPVIIPPVPPPPPISSIGVMDIGQGNCNLMMDPANEPIVYFDLGYPLWFYLGSLPNNMRFGNPAWTGPIIQNQAGTLEVVLSHWDWDHWRMGHVAGMNNIPWTVPNQLFGPAAIVFRNAVNLNGMLTTYGGAPATGFPNYTIFQCAVGPGAPGAMVLNNTGLAISISTNLPTADPIAHYVVMTGDANFNNIPGIAYVNMSGIEAVHHGSNAHGASNNLPVPTGPYGVTGRIFYSYGLRVTAAGAWSYVYGFPVPASVVNYQAAGWTVECSTPEGANIRGLPTTLANRGNIRVANQAALNVFYNYSAFSVFPNMIN